jgi:hypothetical protein
MSQQKVEGLQRQSQSVKIRSVGLCSLCAGFLISYHRFRCIIFCIIFEADNVSVFISRFVRRRWKYGLVIN